MIDPNALKEGQLIEFAGGWLAQVSEPVRTDVVFVRALEVEFYGHHAFAIAHPIWRSAELVEESKEPEKGEEQKEVK